MEFVGGLDEVCRNQREPAVFTSSVKKNPLHLIFPTSYMM